MHCYRELAEKSFATDYASGSQSDLAMRPCLRVRIRKQKELSLERLWKHSADLIATSARDGP